MSEYEEMRAWLGELAAALPEAHRRVRTKRQREIEIDHRVIIKRGTDPRLTAGALMLREMNAVATRLGLTVEYVDRMKWRTALGASDHNGTIRIRDGEHGHRVEPHTAHVLVHELVHEVFHTDPVAKLPKRDELEAEGVAYLLARRYGAYAMDSPLYLATYGITGDLVDRHAHRLIASALFLATLAGRE